jgi:transcriptional regulator GlxA family with amidase domain
MVIVKIAIVLGNETSLSSALTIYDIFDYINSLSTKYRIKLHFLATKRYKVRSENIILNTINLNQAEDDYQFIILPPLRNIKTSVSRDEELEAWLQHTHTKKKSIICSSCASSYFLAYSGLLNNKNATTHWKLEDDFRKKFTKVNLQIQKIIVDENNIITSGGGYSFIDMVFYIINKFISHDIAYCIANLLVIDIGRVSQVYFKTLPLQIKNNDNEIEKLLNWCEKHQLETLTVKKMASFLSISQKTLVRKFKYSTGLSPLEYIQNLKVEKAKLLLVDGTLSFSKISEALGYNNPSSFRKLFKKLTKLTPRQYREKFINISNETTTAPEYMR